MTETNSQPGKTRSLRRRKVGITTNVVVQALAVLILLAMVNWLAARHYLRFDWTKTGYYELAGKTKQVLETLDQPVNVVVFLQPSAELEYIEKVYRDVRNLLSEFEFFGKGRLLVEYVDPQRDLVRAKQLMEQFKVDSANVVIFASGDRTKYVSLEEMVDFDLSEMGQGYRIKAFKGEGVFLSAIQSVTEGEPPVVYFLTGHGERDPADNDQKTGYSTIVQYIKRDNIKVEQWNLMARQSLPEDAAAIVIAGPKQPLTANELALIEDYVNKRGGRLYIMLDPRTKTGLEPALAKWGVQVNNDLALAKGGMLLGTELIVANAVGTEYAPHPITRRLEGVNTVFSYCRSIVRGANNASAVSAPPQVTELVKTPEAYWGETDLAAERSVFDKDTDHPGPLNLAVAVEANKPAGVDLKLGQYRLVVVGTSAFIQNGDLTGGNLDFFMNGLNWLLKREQLVAISPKTPEEFRLDMSPSQLKAVYALVVVVMPMAVALLGILVWMRRRK